MNSLMHPSGQATGVKSNKSRRRCGTPCKAVASKNSRKSSKGRLSSQYKSTPSRWIDGLPCIMPAMADTIKLLLSCCRRVQTSKPKHQSVVLASIWHALRNMWEWLKFSYWTRQMSIAKTMMGVRRCIMLPPTATRKLFTLYWWRNTKSTSSWRAIKAWRLQTRASTAKYSRCLMYLLRRKTTVEPC